jgi:hypothetical protein
MSNDWREYAEVLDDAALAQFLGAHDWTIQQDRDYRQVWTHPVSGSERPFIIQLPRNGSLIDYDRRLSEAIAAASDFYDWSVANLAEAVSSVRADLFFLRVDQSSSDGTIPLRQASSLLENLDSMVRSAALVAHSPVSTGRASRMPEYVKDFLNDDVRMGHTKRGSFIITVAARIGRQQEVQPDSRPTKGQADNPPSAIGSYTRRVMTTLARGIQATKTASQEDATGDELEAAMEGGMRLPLVKALREIGEAEGLRGVSMNFEWSTVEPMTDEVPDEIEIQRDDLRSLDSIEVRLSKRVEPRNETLVGPITELKRPDVAAIDDPTDLSGEVVILADIGGMNRRVTVPLHGEDYDWAIRAHRERLPFTVSGVLEKRGRSWVLTGHIQADTQFLQYHLGQADGPAVEAGTNSSLTDG